jgi:hypothetical protein
MYWECHITIGPHSLEGAKDCVEWVGWKYSKIDGDPSFGEGVREYATMNASDKNPLASVIEYMGETAETIRQCGFPVIRQKVEQVVYDTKGRENGNTSVSQSVGE